MSPFSLLYPYLISLGLQRDGDIIVKPINTAGEHVAIIGLHGALTPPSSYVDLVEKIQARLPHNQVFVGLIGGDIANMPNPVQIGGDIARVKSKLVESGFNGTKFFYLAHSLGGIIMQDHLKDNPEDTAGLILLGSYLQRKYNGVFPVETLTVGAELDGLSRVTRIMEAYYVYIENATEAKQAIRRFPVALIRGACHSQFADENVPIVNRGRDLKPEISFNAAHVLTANVVSNFIKVRLGNDASFDALKTAVEQTGNFFAPLIEAFKLEGFCHFSPPCYDPHDIPKPYCTTGSPWSERAQKLMGGLSIKVNVTDTFHSVSQVVPDYLPKIYNTCPNDTSSCVVSLKTVTENMYSKFDQLDTASYSASASEMRVKLSSRQAVMEAAGLSADFNIVDGPDLCKQINQAALDWALNHSDATVLNRYKQYGEEYVMGPDIGPYNMGPRWIWTDMKYTEQKVSTASYRTEVQSIMMKTPTNYWLKAAAGYHFCKLLSPAHAMEWIYVDSLRKERTYGNGPN